MSTRTYHVRAPAIKIAAHTTSRSQGTIFYNLNIMATNEMLPWEQNTETSQGLGPIGTFRW